MSAPEYRHSRPADLLATVGGDRNTFRLLVDIFTRDTADKLANMHSALETGDREQLAFQTHAIKGTIGPTGADALLRQLMDLEAGCRDRQGLFDKATLADVERQVTLIREELEQFSAGLG